MTSERPPQDPDTGSPGADEEQLLPQLVAHLRDNRTRLREEWSLRIQDANLLHAMSPQEMAAETTSVYDNYVEVLETGSVEALQHYARDLSERIIPRGVETHEVVGIVLLLRDVLARSLFEKYQRDFALLNKVLDAYEPAANRIANTVAVSFVDERERVIRQQQDSIRELSTPVLPVRERLLILPIIGVLDTERARQLTEQLLMPRFHATVLVHHALTEMAPWRFQAGDDQVLQGFTQAWMADAPDTDLGGWAAHLFPGSVSQPQDQAHLPRWRRTAAVSAEGAS